MALSADPQKLTPSKRLRIAVVAGENSGDLLGADLLSAFSEKFPNVEYMGIAGPSMEEKGCRSLYAMEELSVIGVWAILKRLPRLLKMRKQLAQQIIDWHADLFIGIDAPEFNLGLELMLKKAGIKTVHYVSPSVWAWREKRIFKIKKAVDYMLTLFPFENKIYQQHQIPVSTVGHPLADMIPMNPDIDSAREILDIDKHATVLAVLPGSRGSEIKYLGSLFIEVASRLQKECPELKIIVPLVNIRRRQQFRLLLDEIAPSLDITLTNGQSREVMCAANAVLLASGTATLEAMLLKKPMLVSYKVSPLSFAIYSRMLTIKHFALPNLLASQPLIPELIQDDAMVDEICKEISQQLKQGLTNEHLTEYKQIHQSLQLGGGVKAVIDLTEFFDL